MSAPIPDLQFAGQRLGLPEQGPGSVASWGRRVLALFIDWFASLAAANLIASWAGLGADTARALPLGTFLLEATVFTAVLGGSFGQLVCRIVITRLDGTPLNLLQALLRTLLILLVIPPLVFDRDHRGLHDLATGSVARIR